MLKQISAKIGELITGRAVPLIVIVALITGVMAYGVSQIEVRTSVDMLLSKEDPVSVHNERFQQQFGGESLILLIRGEEGQWLNDDTLQKLNALQQDLAGVKRVYSVTSPVSMAQVFAQQADKQQQDLQQQMQTKVQEAMAQAAGAAKESGANEAQQTKAAEAAKQQVEQAIQAQYGEQMTQMGQIGDLTATNAKFVKYAMYDGQGKPQAAVAALLPEDGKDLLFNIQLDSGLTMQDMAAATDDIQKVIDAHPLDQTDSLFSGLPAISKALEDYISQDIVTMLSTVIVLMIIVLALVFPVRWRLLSLPVVLTGMIWTFGLMGFIGMPLSIATMALLPILIGLGTDFALQFHNRYEEELVKESNSQRAIASAIRHMGPAVGIAVVIMAAGFLTLLMSDMPMIKDFGAMLAIGVCIMYAISLLLLLPVLALRDCKGFRIKQGKSGGFVERRLGALARGVVKRPVIMLIIPVAIAGAGFAVDHRLHVESNIEKLMPQNAPELIAMNEIRDIVGSTLTIDWMVEAEDVTKPEVIQWMDGFEKKAAAEDPEVAGSSSIITAMESVQPDIAGADEQTIQSVLGQMPSEITSPFLTEDHRMARITLTLKDDTSTKDQELLLGKLESDLNAPAGVSVSPVGMQVLQVKSLNGLTDSRHTSLLSGLLAILLGLVIVYRNLKRAFFPILPIVLVNGWSTALLYVMGIAINPLTAVLGSLVLGIGTEFTILLMERYLEEKAKGEDTETAIVTAMTKVGRAITASGLTVVGGFSALIFTNFEVVKVFGVSTVTDTLLCLISTLTVLPAIIILFDKDKRPAAEKTVETANATAAE